jgi:thioester reductase-like protein
MMEGIFNSHLFSLVFEEQPDLRQNLSGRVKAIAGDLVSEGLGISPADRLMIVNEVNIIINCAASVNFDDPLLEAIQINYMGCNRLVKLALECKQLITFTHVSTAYVNSNRLGLIEEKIYDLPGVDDPEEEILKLSQLKPEYVKENEKKLIKGFPNTYTFTKSMAERMVKKLCSKIRASIIRPSIIIGTYEEPFAGWAENLAAGGGITLTTGIGVLRNVKSNTNQIIDTVPCDYVANMIIAASAYAAFLPEPRLSVYHHSSS